MRFDRQSEPEAKGSTGQRCDRVKKREVDPRIFRWDQVPIRLCRRYFG